MMTNEELEADLNLLRTQVPTLEEQLFSVVVPCWNNTSDKISGATAMTLLIAPIPLRILSAVCSWDYWNLPAHEANYWKADLNRGTGPDGFTSIAIKTTQTTGALAGGAVTARKAWPLDSANWGGADLAAGDLLRLTASPIGSPASDWDLPMTVTIRYRPL